MSGQALYKVVVRMLYDPEFVRAVYNDPEAALADAFVTPSEQRWLVQPDPRAYRTDPMRRSRSLAGLMEEFPVSSAFVLRRGREGVMRPETELLDAFFSSPVFHACMRDGGSMVFAFADYLERGEHKDTAADPRVAPLARLERSIARLRRVEAGAGPSPFAGTGTPPDGGVRPARVALAPWVEPLSLPAGTWDLYGRVHKALSNRGEKPLRSLLNPRWSLPVLPEFRPEEREHILVERLPAPGIPWDETPVRHAPVTGELFGLLQAARAGIGQEDLRRTAGRLGADEGTEAEIVEGLLAEGVLLACG